MNMAWIEVVDKRKMKGILIDGYIFSFADLKQLDWKKVELGSPFPYDPRSGELLQKMFKGHLMPHKPIPSEGVQAKYINGLVNSVRAGFCSYNMEPCGFFGGLARVTKGRRTFEREVSCYTKNIRDKVLPVFTREIDKDFSEGKSNYFFEATVLDLTRENYCPVFENCSEHWMDIFGFKIKDEKDYADFPAFKDAARTYLKAYMTLLTEVSDIFHRREKSDHLYDI